MEYIVQIITQPNTVFVFVAIILATALWPLYLAIVSINRVNQEVREANNVLLHLGKNKPYEFYSQFREVHGQVVKIPVLRHTWRQFVDSMYFEDVNAPDEYKKVYISERPSHYFHRDSVLGTRLNLSQFFAYPNYLIGLGLTFTFIGLAAALHVAQAGLASGAGQQALEDLLAVASIKFISSIAGIICSLVVSAVQRARVRAFQRNLNVFCDLLEECTKYKSTEKLLHDSFNELRRQSMTFNDIGQTIADKINETISEQLSISVTNGLEPLTKDIRSLAQNFSEGSEQALSKMLEAFLHELRSSSEGQMQRLMNSAETLQASLNQLAAHMESAGKHLDSHTKASVSQLDMAMDKLSASLAPVQSGMAQFGQLLQGLDAVSEKIEKAGSHMQSAASENQHNVSEFGKTLADMSLPLASMPNILTSLTQSLDKVEGTSSSFTAAGESIFTAVGAFKDSVELAKRSEDAFGRNVAMITSQAQNASEVMAALDKASSQLGNMVASLDSLDKNLSQSAKSLDNALRQIGADADHASAKPKSQWWKP